MLKRKLQKTINDTYILTLPKALILAIGLKKGTDLEITLKNERIILTPAKEVDKTSKDAGVPTYSIRGVVDGQ